MYLPAFSSRLINEPSPLVVEHIIKKSSLSKELMLSKPGKRGRKI
jgi:hypothetical protein